MIEKRIERMLLSMGKTAQDDEHHMSIDANLVNAKCKTKVKLFDGFYYAVLDHNKMRIGDKVPPKEISKESIKALLGKTCKCMFQNYMNSAFISKEEAVNENIDVGMETQRERINSIHDNVRWMEEKNVLSHPVFCRIERSHNLTTSCLIERAIHVINTKKDYYNIIMIQVNEVGNVVACYFLTMYNGANGDDHVYIEQAYNVAIYTSKMNKVDEAICKHEAPLIVLGMVDPYVLYEVCNCLQVIRDQWGRPVKDLRRPEYTSTEKWFQRKLYQTYFHGTGVALHGVKCSDFSSDKLEKYQDVIDRVSKSYPESAIWDSPDNEWPVIDLTDREMNFILKWMIKNHILLSDDDEGYLPLDMIKYAKCKYGNCFRRNMKFGDEKRKLYISWQLDLGTDMWIVNFAERINENLSAVMMISFCDASKWDFGKSIVEISTSVLIQNGGYTYNTYDDIKKQSMILNWKMEDAIENVFWIVKVLVSIEERPDRTKMIKKTENRSEDKKDKKGNKNKGKKQNKTEKEYVIERILKPTKEAKQYVQDHTSGSSDRQFNYVMEEWEREGHYRHYKNGKTIYIESTTCHRHEPLTDKEIHLKL